MTESFDVNGSATPANVLQDVPGKVRWGIIGAGGIAVNRMIPALLQSEGCTVDAVMRTDATKLAAVQQQFGIRHGFTTAEELVRSGVVDAVYIASPVYAHAKQAIMCAEAGIPILVEKPVGMNAQELHGLRQACRENAVFFDGAFMMRYHTLHRKMREMVLAGAIGVPVMVRIDFGFWYPYAADSWRQRRDVGGGGVFMDLGPHCLDLLQFVTGRKISEVKAALMNTQTFSYEVEDSATVLLELEGGGHASISTHFNIPEDTAANRLEIYGTQGALMAEGTLGQMEQGKLLYKRTGDTAVYEIARNEQQHAEVQHCLYSRELEHFLALRNDPSRWEEAMDEQIRLQVMLDEAYRLGS